MIGKLHLEDVANTSVSPGNLDQLTNDLVQF